MLLLCEEVLWILGSLGFLTQRQTDVEHSTEVAKLKKQKSQKDIQARILPDYLGFIRTYSSSLGILQISLCLSVFIPMKKKKV